MSHIAGILGKGKLPPGMRQEYISQIAKVAKAMKNSRLQKEKNLAELTAREEGWVYAN